MLLNTDTTALPVSVRYNVQTMDVKKTVHDEQGRVIVAKFEQFSILHTYVILSKIQHIVTYAPFARPWKRC